MTSNFYADFSSNNSLTILLIIGLVFLWGLTILCLISNLFILVDMPTVASKIVYDGIPLVFFSRNSGCHMDIIRSSIQQKNTKAKRVAQV